MTVLFWVKGLHGIYFLSPEGKEAELKRTVGVN